MFEPPPAMVAEISEWVLAVVAAEGMVQQERRLEQLKRHRTEQESDPAVKHLRDAIEELRRVVPREGTVVVARAYKAFYEAAFRFMAYGAPKAGMAEFTGLKDPKARQEMVEMVHRAIAHVEQWFESNYQRIERIEIPGVLKDLALYRDYLRPGVVAELSDKPFVDRLFPINLAGWKYGGASIVEALRTKAIELATGVATTWREMARNTTPEQQAALAPVIEQMIDNAKKEWAHLRVRLSRRGASERAKGSWNEASEILQVNLSDDFNPWRDARDLEATVYHELQHFGQTLLSKFHGVDSMIEKRRPGPGMPSRHIMTPQFKQQRGDESKPTVRGPAPDQLHYLDDVEFYTDLRGAAERLRPRLRMAKIRLKEGFTPEVQREMVRVYVGGARLIPEALRGMIEPDPFFSTLRRYAPGKWKKAVAELAKMMLAWKVPGLGEKS